MNEFAAYHRDAARVFREQGKLWENQGKKRKANFFRDQAKWHEIEATRLDDNDFLELTSQEFFLLMARELRTQGFEIGWFVNQNTPYLAHVLVRHPFIGKTLSISLPAFRVPNWIPVWEPEPIELDPDEQLKYIDQYLRPLTGQTNP